ncbi:uncharacterized protein LOC112554889 isoform X3 [Pomacea canaliculata]|uniref:uncharacterized protein LOC112554889 isoform X3 n=1 Tax=Pomacea canaliculata TaxID=400727 RepID=UPI000D731B5E|nr:uncharacterized protein LOC112554889 isoform X3 [Pomacea canaliculata]
MELTKKRITAFNAFCSQKQKDDPQIGLGCKLWSREWRSMGPVEREDYQKIAKGLSLKGLSPDKCYRNIIKELQEMPDSQYESVCVLSLQNNQFACKGFGPLTHMLDDFEMNSTIFGFVSRISEKAKKETVISLRGKVREKLSKIAKRDLGLNQFPYKRLQRGEFEVEGVPSSLLPLKPLLKMNSLELKQLMDSAVSIKRISATHLASHRHSPEDATEETHHTPNTVMLHCSDTIHQIDHNKHTYDTVQQKDPIDISHPIPHTVHHTGIMQAQDKENRDTSQVQMQTGDLSRNFTLESSGGTQQQTAVLGDSGELVSGYTNKENESGNPQQITASIVHLGSTTTQVQPKPKRQRLRWNSEALKALEDSLGPLFALDGPLPGSDRLEHIRNSKQVLQKYSVQQIYQKLFKMINKKKKQEESKTFGQN